MKIKNKMYEQKIEKMEKDANRFSIRKLSIGAASVLIGLTMMGVESQTVKADTPVSSDETEQTTEKAAGQSKNADVNQTHQDQEVKATPSMSDKDKETKQQSSDRGIQPNKIVENKSEKQNGGVEKPAINGYNITPSLNEHDKSSDSDPETTTLNIDKDKNAGITGLAESKAIDLTPVGDTGTYNLTGQWSAWNVEKNADGSVTITNNWDTNATSLIIPNSKDIGGDIYLTPESVRTLMAYHGNLNTIKVSDTAGGKVIIKGDNWNDTFNHSNSFDPSTFTMTSSLTEVDLNNTDVSQVTNMSNMFSNMKKLTTISGISDWDTSHVTDMSNMFSGDTNLTSVGNLQNWSNSSLGSFDGMFANTKVPTSEYPSWARRQEPIPYTQEIIYEYNGESVSSKNDQPVEITRSFNAGTTATITSDDIKSAAEANLNPDYQISAGQTYSPVTVDDNNYNSLPPIVINVTPIPRDYTQKIIYQYAGKTIAPKTGTDPKLTGTLDSNNKATISANDIQVAAEAGMNPAYVVNNTYQFKDETINSQTPADLVVEVQPIAYKDWVYDSDNQGNITLHDYLGNDQVVTVPNNKDLGVNNVYVDVGTGDGGLIRKSFFENLNAKGVKDITISKTNNGVVTVPAYIDPNTHWNYAQSNYLFANCNNFVHLDLSNLDTHKMTNAEGLFFNDPNLVSIDGLTNWNMQNVGGSLKYMFGGDSKLQKLNLTSWKLHNMSSMYGAFKNCQQLTELKGLDRWIVGTATDMGEMFANTLALTSVGNVANWNVGNVTNMTGMFFGSGLTSLDVSHWKPAKVTTTNLMFANDSKLHEINGLENWANYVGQISNSSEMFERTGNQVSGLKLNLSNWKLTSDNYTYWMFNNTGATYINLNGVDISNVKNVENMFQDFVNPATIDMHDIKLPTNPDTGKNFQASTFSGNQPLVVFSTDLNSLNQEAAVSNGIGHPANIITLYAGDAVPSTLRAMPSPIGHVQIDFVYANPEDFNAKLAAKLSPDTINQNNNDYNLIDAYKNKHVYATSSAQNIPEDNYPARVAGMWNLFFNPQTPTGQTYTQKIIYQLNDENHTQIPAKTGTHPELAGHLENGSATLSKNEVNNKINECLPAGYKIVNGEVTGPITINKTNPNAIIVTIAPVQYNVTINYKYGTTTLGQKTISGNLINDGTNGQKDITLAELKDFPTTVPAGYEYQSNDKGITANSPLIISNTTVNPENIVITVALTKQDGNNTTGDKDDDQTNILQHNEEPSDNNHTNPSRPSNDQKPDTEKANQEDSSQNETNDVDTEESSKPNKKHTQHPNKKTKDTNPAVLVHKKQKHIVNEHAVQLNAKMHSMETVRRPAARKLPQTGSKKEVLVAALGLAVLSVGAIISLADRRRKN